MSRGQQLLRIFALLVLLGCLLVQKSDGFWRRRRRRRSCSTGTWTPWTACSVTCRHVAGTKSRQRTSTCAGTVLNQKTKCNAPISCPIDCVVNAWVTFGAKCSTTCGQGYKLRRRTVRKPALYGGTACPKLFGGVLCSLKDCPGPPKVDCAVSPWSSWSACPCGVPARATRQTRSRTITTYPAHGGQDCPNTVENRACPPKCCKQDCIVSAWSVYGPCTTSCGLGIKTRTRSIVRAARCGGRACPTLLSKRKKCDRVKPRNCQVNSWTPWLPCKCGSKNQQRLRYIHVQPQCGGRPCPSLTDLRKPCPLTCCPQDCTWSHWSAFSACTASCGYGIRVRYRKVLTEESCGGACNGGLVDHKICRHFPAINCLAGPWGTWGKCSIVCGKAGTQVRRRSIVRPASCRGTCRLLQSKPCSGLPDAACGYNKVRGPLKKPRESKRFVEKV